MHFFNLHLSQFSLPCDLKICPSVYLQPLFFTPSTYDVNYCRNK